MRSSLLALAAAACATSPPPALDALTTPGLVGDLGGQTLTVELPSTAYLTIFALGIRGYPVLVSPVEPLGRLSFGPLGPGRSQLRITQAALRGPSTLLAIPESSVWTFGDFPLIVVLTSGAPLTADQFVRAYDAARTPFPISARSGKELHRARQEIAARLIADFQAQGAISAAGVFERP